MIEGKYPAGVESQLLPGERIEYFSYISQKGGCGSTTPREEHWIAMTDRRILYRALVRELEKNRTLERDGLIPLDKVSLIEVTQATQSGCGSLKSFELRIGSSGSHVVIPLPTVQKGLEIRQNYATIHERGNTGRQR